MVWGNHKEGDCQLGKEHINKQNSSLNQVAAKAASATVFNPEWQALIVNMACNMANDRLSRPAWKPLTNFWVVFMAEANLNKAHQVLTYLMLLFFPTILCWLLTKLVEVSHSLMHQWEWNHICLTARNYPKKHHKKKKQDN